MSGSNKNIFNISNPSKMLDALWTLIDAGGNDFSNIIIFLPSRRAVRSVEKLFVEKIGGAVLLPTLVPLGEGSDEDEVEETDIISNSERVLILAKLLTADPNIRTISNALPIARDLVRMQDYLENEGVDTTQINWTELVDEKYAAHFAQKAEFLKIVTHILPTQTDCQTTQSAKRNADIRGWTKQLSAYSKVIVCGSTASVPATADLMVYIAGLENGYIILPGKINGCAQDFELDTNPYNSEYKFLKRINIAPGDVQTIDVGASDIDFFNAAFSNTGARDGGCSAKLIECNREAEEAEVVAEIAARAISDDKTVLVITPDAAGTGRIATALMRRNLSADFSGGISGTMTDVGRAILNLMDDAAENKDPIFDAVYKDNNNNLFDTIVSLVDNAPEKFNPSFKFDSDAATEIWGALQKTSDALSDNGIVLGLSDARAVVADTLSGISIRPPMQTDAKIAVLGTIESRMQTADVVVLTGLNEGMFPDTGYENAWLPRATSEQIGLPSPDRKVSLMALDFINLSCGATVYWTRSRTAGSSVTTESRFLSRVDVAQGGVHKDNEILDVVRDIDNVPYSPLDYSPPRPPADRTDVYVTELELLIHNPYAFYARHILRLRPMDDYWTEPDARDFGNLVHGVIEEGAGKSADVLITEMDKRAREILPIGSVLFHFWHKRFTEIAPMIASVLNTQTDAYTEIKGTVKIAGRNVHGRADRISDGVVVDIKTGTAPNQSQLEKGNMPQLPLEAYMMQTGGFGIKTSDRAKTPVIQFLQLANRNIKLIEYDGETTQRMIDASVDKVSQLFGRYSRDFEPYEYYETSDAKYKAYDDLARIDD